LTSNHRKVTLLVQDLQGLAKFLQADQRYPALEMILSRGRHFRAEAQSPDHFRFRLFGVRSDGELPIAALTRAGDGAQKPDPQQYWLRTDPVTLWADMARVVMTSYGFADLDEFERNEIENSVRSVLLEEGVHLHADHTERWCIALGEPLSFRFTPLEEALGMDLAEAMPEQPESLHWRRIMNEIQMALHACPVNVRRRQRGQQEINSVWFWGGGFIPDASRHGVFDTVYSDNPVSRGLGTINDCRLKHQSEAGAVDFSTDGQSVLVDWSSGSGDPYRELKLLENLASRLLEDVRGAAIKLEVYCGKHNGWRFRKRSGRKFWRRIRSLAEVCNQRFSE
jgi:hypothetical protein